MNPSIESKKTSRLLATIAIIKKRELRDYNHKVLELEKQIETNANHKLNSYKYQLIQSRLMKLKTTIKSLKQLELQLHK
ncbi:hypothetical protein ITJ86_04485 [Winogradskyella sp. F6397]|uniref:DUF465 domain-containing protein n=1 Tax=Winogradskyella marina TaxID=2785530 RepID=A0ABS0EFA3_9FLAO|nr:MULTISPECIES: hypothetical protein [Winogradskyella]MBF8149140.1 hypothetical protein [Winogradskyella marina]